jgi:predicted metal-dependent phosphoesterase TrpH
MTARYDLHCHSTASDGALSPTALVQRAHQHGVTDLALTDHDTVDGLAEAQAVADQLGIRFINGIELSATHLNQCLHIVGININPQHAHLRQGLDEQQRIRGERAHKIAEKLAKKRIPDAYPAVALAAGSGEITRSHFADFLVAQGYVSTQQEAFDRYLSAGQSAYVPTVWADLATVVQWIVGAGGVAILAHPMRYKLSNNWLNRMLKCFIAAGGQGIEVVTGRASADEIRYSLQLATTHQLYASMGSDFHSPDNPFVELGRLADLPNSCRPVWQLFH